MATDDPLLAKMTNSENIALTESDIKKNGRDAAILKAVESLAKVRIKYRISELESLASSRIGLSLDEISTLIRFAAASAKNRALIDVVSNCRD